MNRAAYLTILWVTSSVCTTTPAREQIKPGDSSACATRETRNIALGKIVRSDRAEAGGYARPSAHLTDGNLKTDAYPGAFALAYTVDLTTFAEAGNRTEPRSFDIDSIVIYWGHYGRHFPGTKREDGSWAPAAYKADYVNQYKVFYRKAGVQDWVLVHACTSMPTVEDAKNVAVTRVPDSASESEGDVTTTLTALNLQNVIELRIEAGGGHWIGVYELMAFGKSSAAEPGQRKGQTR